jgi:O-antigen ligase
LAVFLATITFALLVARVVIPASWVGTDEQKYDPSEAAALLNKISWLTFLGVSSALLFARSSAAVRLVRATNPFFLALLVFAAGSVLWSIDPGASVARLLHVLTIFLCCAAVALVGWHPRRFQETVRPAFTLLLAGSLVFGLLAPELAIQPAIPPETKDSWRGLADQKNQLGALASIGTILWFHGWAAREVKFFTAFFWGSTCAACLYLSRSSTNLLATVLVCIFLLMLLRTTRGFRAFMPYVVGAFAGITIIYSLAVLRVIPALDILLDPISTLTGKDKTFSNRTEIWELIRQHISLSPVLGSGYGAYWTGPLPSSPSYIFFSKLYFYPGECHNGYLEIINDLGYAGLLLLLGYLWNFLRGSLRLLKSNYSQAGLYIAMLFQQLLTNLSESHWLFISADLIMFTLATLCLVRSADVVPARPANRLSGRQESPGAHLSPITPE